MYNLPNIFFTSDHHFFHKNIIEYSQRPYSSIEEMNEDFIKRWNGVVKVEDHVFHLGDFSFGSIEMGKSILSRLNGHKFLIKGNHDKSPKAMEEMGFLRVDSYWTETFEPGERVYMSHKPIPPYERLNSPFKYYLNGHVHNLWKFNLGKNYIQINVGVDQWNYTPVSLNQIREFSLDKLKSN